MYLWGIEDFERYGLKTAVDCMDIDNCLLYEGIKMR